MRLGSNVDNCQKTMDDLILIGFPDRVTRWVMTLMNPGFRGALLMIGIEITVTMAGCPNPGKDSPGGTTPAINVMGAAKS